MRKSTALQPQKYFLQIFEQPCLWRIHGNVFFSQGAITDHDQCEEIYPPRSFQGRANIFWLRNSLERLSRLFWDLPGIKVGALRGSRQGSHWQPLTNYLALLLLCVRIVLVERPSWEVPRPQWNQESRLVHFEGAIKDLQQAKIDSVRPIRMYNTKFIPSVSFHLWQCLSIPYLIFVTRATRILV